MSAQVKMDDVDTAFQLFYQFLKKGMLEREKHPDLFDAYKNNASVNAIFDEVFSKHTDSKVLQTPFFLYWCPNPGNRFFGQSNEELKARMARGDGTIEQLYLSYFIITCLLAEYYREDSVNSEDLEEARTYVTVDELVDIVTERLEEIRKMDTDEVQMLEKELDSNLLDAARLWFSIPKTLVSGVRIAGTKSQQGVVLKVLSYLEEEELAWVVDKREVRLSDKTKAIVRHYYGDSRYKQKILSYLIEKKEA